jgi:hypothetical protein
LDAKSAFDVVVHKNLLKKLYHLGIQDKHWTLIKSLHTNASSAIKFNGLVLENFNILQGVRQGGLLSADLYKIYIDPLLKQLQQSTSVCLVFLNDIISLVNFCVLQRQKLTWHPIEL